MNGFKLGLRRAGSPLGCILQCCILLCCSLPVGCGKKQPPDPQAETLEKLAKLADGAVKFERATTGYPVNIPDAAGKPLLSWRVMILPYLDHTLLFNEFKRDEPWDSPWNIKILKRMPNLYRSAGDAKDSTSTRFQVAVGPGTPFEIGGRVSAKDIKDGVDQTIMLVEVAADKAVPWTKPDDFSFDPRDPLKGIGQLEFGCLPAVFFDAKSKCLPRSLKPEILKALLQSDGGKVDLKELNLSGD